jgi:hypothetical protein
MAYAIHVECDAGTFFLFQASNFVVRGRQRTISVWWGRLVTEPLEGSKPSQSMIDIAVDALPCFTPVALTAY